MFDLVCKLYFVKFLEEFVKFMILLWLGKYFGIILWINNIVIFKEGLTV